jgi:NADH-quinone oxidoreductase subunit J
VTGPRQIAILLAAVLLALGVWLLLPPGGRRHRTTGALVVAFGLGLLASRLPRLGEWVSQSVFSVLAITTVVSAAAAITFRNPVYCALWLGLSLVGTAGLFFIQGSQFLAVATIVVYAGAILVTFLFLLMLAEPSGRARYDRTSWEGLLSAASGAVLVGLLSTTVLAVLDRESGSSPPVVVTDEDRQDGILNPEHVRPFGEVLFNRYLIAAEAGGVLLFAALVGAAVIVGPPRKKMMNDE